MLDPDIIVADEPTTALDVTIQAEIMTLLRELCEKHNVGLVLITHDLGVVSQMTQRTLVMYAGRVIEQGPTREIINDAQHPYTQGLLNALPQMTTPGEPTQPDSRLNALAVQYAQRLRLSSALPIPVRRHGTAAPRCHPASARVRDLGQLPSRLSHGA